MANNCTASIPYWSIAPGREVYHNCKNCSVGNNIESKLSQIKCHASEA